MNRKISAILCSILLVSSFAAAQKKPAPKPATITAVQDGPKEPITNYVYLVTLDKNSAASISVRGDNGTDSLSQGQFTDLFSDLSRLQNSKATAKYKEARSPAVIIRPDPALNYGVLFDTAKAARTDSNFRVSVEIETAFYIQVPKKADPRVPVRPDPTTLVVELDTENNITLNNEPHGTLSDPAPLTETLKRVFSEREANGVFREATNDLETTVSLKLPRTAPVVDLIKLARVVRAAGSDTIRLDLGENEVIRITMEKLERPRQK